jgi:hypothetical protein
VQKKWPRHLNGGGGRYKIEPRKSRATSVCAISTSQRLVNDFPLLTKAFRQKAFRERKEIHIKALEAELKDLQHRSLSIIGENVRL